ncbi:hypothetical protein B0H17DRAFT_1215047 [Mycena rosella]|uniref:Uncharacterized protein n=1 Tax=Mycena rosella TaxID=1033263 RepID=A0AAD7CLN8_MYCRO|nr:hypothetical protein B0H17DRAFT_1215047 [Mycena rosella]
MVAFTPPGSEPLPPSVSDLLADRPQSRARYPLNRPRTWRISRARASLPFALLSSILPAPRNPDTAAASFYRIYELFVLDWTTALRNELEYFCCSHPDWAVAALPDPADSDPLRAAIFAVLTQFMCDAFNRRIQLGLPRDAPAIILDFDELKARPKVLEHPPEWAVRTPPLRERVVLPDEHGAYPDETDPATSEHFKAMNIVVYTPHIHFI